MPARSTERFFNSAQKWKQVSTNVSPEMHKALKSQVTSVRTMSHVIRELIQESALMRYGRMPQPAWSDELAQSLALLRTEVAELKAELATKTEQARPEPVADRQQEKATIVPGIEPVSLEAEAESKGQSDTTGDEQEFNSELIIQQCIDDEMSRDPWSFEKMRGAGESEKEEQEKEAPILETAPQTQEEAQPEIGSGEIQEKRKPFAFLGKIAKMVGVARKTA